MRAHIFGAGLGLFMLGACGGGGGSGSGSGGGGGTPAIPNLNVTLSASETAATIEEDDVPASVSFTATSSGSVATPVFADVAYDPEIFASVNVAAGATANAYTVTATPRPDIGGGDFDGKITFRLCMEAACTRVYGGSTRVHTHKLKVQLRDWVMFQRDAAHTGYVHVRLDPSKFKKAWEWVNPDHYLVTSVVSSGGNAYFSNRLGVVYSVDEKTGAQNWMYDLKDHDLYYAGDLSYHNGRVYVPSVFFDPNQSTSSGKSRIAGLDAKTGEMLTYSPFISQMWEFNSPTILDGEMYFSHGYYGGVLYKYNLPEGGLVWESAYIGSNSMANQTPAVDKKYVYYNTYFGLAVYDKISGSLIANIDNDRKLYGGENRTVAPVISKSGVLYYNMDDGNSLKMANIEDQSVYWRADGVYQASYAVRDNVIYALSAYPAEVHALDEANGQTLWKWVLPEEYVGLVENIIITDNLVFVSSDKFVYAIDTDTHKTVWTYPSGGKLSLSSGFMLYISNNTHGQSGKITAISLR